MAELVHITYCPLCEGEVPNGTCWKHPNITPQYTERKVMRWIVYDIETLRFANDVGGWDALREDKKKYAELGLSCCAIWDSDSAETNIYGGEEIETIVSVLEGADVACSFNGNGFDIWVLAAIAGRYIRLEEHLDLLQLIWKHASRANGGNKLEDVAQRTLGRGKAGTSEQAPLLVGQGRWAELHRYCMEDVRLTRDLFRFAQRNGYVKNAHDVRVPIELPEWFRV